MGFLPACIDFRLSKQEISITAGQPSVAVLAPPAARDAARHGGEPSEVGRASWTEPTESPAEAA